jgi:hypothetical protein
MNETKEKLEKIKAEIRGMARYLDGIDMSIAIWRSQLHQLRRYHHPEPEYIKQRIRANIVLWGREKREVMKRYRKMLTLYRIAKG